MINHFCRVCGLYSKTPPWGEDNQTPTYEICSCCGVEFGNEDYTLGSIKSYRDNWINSGLKWFDPKERPANWDYKKQLENIPKEYL